MDVMRINGIGGAELMQSIGHLKEAMKLIEGAEAEIMRSTADMNTVIGNVMKYQENMILCAGLIGRIEDFAQCMGHGLNEGKKVLSMATALVKDQEVEESAEKFFQATCNCWNMADTVKTALESWIDTCPSGHRCETCQYAEHKDVVVCAGCLKNNG